jgi:D-amino-acid dehydrogenase
MRVGIIGAGVVGLTTAHALQLRGHDVSILDADEHVGCGASFANAGQLAYANATPLGSPALLRQVFGVLLGRAKGVSVGIALEPRYLRWLSAFLWQCLPHACRRNSDQLAYIAERSMQRMAIYREAFGEEYSHRRSGKIVLLEKPDEKAEPIESLARHEPALNTWNLNATHGSYAAGDEVGDARRFTQALARRLSEAGVTFCMNARVERLEKEVRGWRVHTSRGDQHYQTLVLCSGNGTPALLGSLRIHAPVYPVAGFSYTFPAGAHANTTSITIAEHKIVFSRLGEQVRIAGYASIHRSASARLVHARQMLAVARRIAPQAAEYDTLQVPWIGFRPATPSSLPMVGASQLAGLYYNFGHGMLGWTLCAATAEQVANAIEHQQRA